MPGLFIAWRMRALTAGRVADIGVTMRGRVAYGSRLAAGTGTDQRPASSRQPLAAAGGWWLVAGGLALELAWLLAFSPCCVAA